MNCIPFGNSTGRNIFLISTPVQLVFANMVARQMRLDAEYLIATDRDTSVRQIEKVSVLLGVRNISRLISGLYKVGDRFRQFRCETLRFLRMLGEQRLIVGADVNELCPGPIHAADYAVAKLCYKILAYSLRVGSKTS